MILYRIVSPNLAESPLSVILELTTLSYWLQLEPTDWYLNCIIAFYIFFPFFRKWISWKLLTFVTLAVVLFDQFVKVRWDLASGIDRLPIFLLGIMCSAKNLNRKSLLVVCTIATLSSVPLYMFISERLALSFIIFVILSVLSICKSVKEIKLIEWLGKHSLQLYAANQLTFMFMNVANRGLVIASIAFVALQCIFTIILILSEKKIRDLLSFSTP